jgi:hypothetical protein
MFQISQHYNTRIIVRNNNNNNNNNNCARREDEYKRRFFTAADGRRYVAGAFTDVPRARSVCGDYVFSATKCACSYMT